VRVTQSTKHWGLVCHHEVHDAITMMRMQFSHRTRSITIGSPYHVLGTRNTSTSSLTVKSEESSNQTTIRICPSNFIWTLLGVSRQSRLKAAHNPPEGLEYCPERAEKSALIQEIAVSYLAHNLRHFANQGEPQRPPSVLVSTC
jgi:hypothetical protein